MPAAIAIASISSYRSGSNDRWAGSIRVARATASSTVAGRPDQLPLADNLTLSSV